MALSTPKGQMLARVDPEPSAANSAAELNQSDGEALNFLLPEEVSKEGQLETFEKSTLSKWTIGWWTPLILVGFYLFALITAVLHYVFFHFLDGKPSNGDLNVLSQSWVTTISTLLVTVFKFALLSSLSVAGTQYLWFVVRKTTLRVVTLDALFSIRSSLMALVQPSVMRAAPVLFLLAVLCQLTAVAIIYPPGALTVVSRPFVNATSAQVRTFNSSISYPSPSLSNTFFPRLAESQFERSAAQYISPVPSLYRIALKTLLSGNILPSSTPCGPNCTYTIQFDGPDINCGEVISANVSRSFTKEMYVDNQMGINLMYSAQESRLATDPKISVYPWTLSRYDISTSRIVGFWPLATASPQEQKPSANTEYIWESHNMTCQPGWATYKTTMSWKDGAREISYGKQPHGDLVNLQTDHNWVGSGRKWNRVEYAPLWARDSNLQAIYQTLTDTLAGNFSSLVSPTSWADGLHKLNETFTLPNGTVVSLGKADVLFQSLRWQTDKLYGANGTAIANTRFNKNGDAFFFATEDQGPKFSITEELLQEALFNITLSAILLTDLGNQTTTVTTTVFQNVYVFSEKLQFFIPYFGTLVITIPFLILGLLALRWNGVSAAEGFMQILTTTTGSKALEKASAGGCLGGEANMPEDLKELRVRFGELVGITGDGKRGIRRAGFGIENEVVPLRRGGNYGIVVQVQAE